MQMQILKPNLKCLAVSAHDLGVSSLPRCSTRSTNGSIGSVSWSSKTSVLSTGWGKSTSLSVLVDRVADPVNTRIVADSSVLRIDQDHFEVLVGGILINPITVKNSQVSTDTSNTLFGNWSKISSEFNLIYTRVLGLSENNTLYVKEKRGGR